MQCETLLREHEADRASEANVVVWLGGLEAMRGDFESARKYVERARERYLELGLTMAAIDVCGRVLGEVEMLARSPNTAEPALRKSCEVLQERQHSSELATRAAELAEVLYAQGQYGEAEAWTYLARDSAGADDLDALLSWQPVHAKLLARNGDLEQAEHLMRRTLALATPTDGLNRIANVFLAMAEVLRLAGRDEESTEADRSALNLYELKGNLVASDRLRASLVMGVTA